MDFVLLVLRKLLRSNSPYVKVIPRSLNKSLLSSFCNSFTFYIFQIILMSATITCKQFAEYFSTTILGKMNPAYVFEVDGAPYSIEEFYLDDLQLFPSKVK